MDGLQHGDRAFILCNLVPGARFWGASQKYAEPLLNAALRAVSIAHSKLALRVKNALEQRSVVATWWPMPENIRSAPSSFVKCSLRRLAAAPTIHCMLLKKQQFMLYKLIRSLHNLIIRPHPHFQRGWLCLEQTWFHSKLPADGGRVV